MNFTVENRDIEGCHGIGNDNQKTTVIRFVNGKFCNLILKKLTMLNWVFRIMSYYLLVKISLPLTRG